MPGSKILRENPPKDTLGDNPDVLYTQVSDMLDMRLYEYKLNLKICRDSRQLNGICRGLYGKNLNTISFYSQDTNTIYLSADNFKRNILRHELAHAIIAHYFVIPPPAKIHEILSMHVEYQLRRFGE